MPNPGTYYHLLSLPEPTLHCLGEPHAPQRGNMLLSLGLFWAPEPGAEQGSGNENWAENKRVGSPWGVEDGSHWKRSFCIEDTTPPPRPTALSQTRCCRNGPGDAGSRIRLHKLKQIKAPGWGPLPSGEDWLRRVCNARGRCGG